MIFTEQIIIIVTSVSFFRNLYIFYVIQTILTYHTFLSTLDKIERGAKTSISNLQKMHSQSKYGIEETLEEDIALCLDASRFLELLLTVPRDLATSPSVAQTQTKSPVLCDLLDFNQLHIS